MLKKGVMAHSLHGSLRWERYSPDLFDCQRTYYSLIMLCGRKTVHRAFAYNLNLMTASISETVNSSAIYLSTAQNIFPVLKS